jgi:hypothetical protein
MYILHVQYAKKLLQTVLQIPEEQNRLFIDVLIAKKVLQTVHKKHPNP